MAIGLKPDYAEAHNNLGATLQKQCEFDEAMAGYDRAIELKPDYAEAHFNRSLLLLLTGNFKEGWPEYEWRLRKKDNYCLNIQQPRWDGSPLNGRNILVHAEQGYGDAIQFARYLPLVKAKGGNVILECRKVLTRLLKGVAGVDKISEPLSDKSQNIQFDLHVPLLSLPGIFNTTLDTIPSDVPYIKPDPELVSQWNVKLGRNGDFKIGIVWAGSKTYKNNLSRSCLLSDFVSLAKIPGVTFCSLQKESASKEAHNPPGGMKITNLDKGLNDFADTAAVIANLDLVISVDTAVVHLAGAIGKPVWTLLPFAPDWRWLLNRDDSPWYPSMRLFRQTKPNDWDGVFEQVKDALLKKLAS